MLLGNAGPVIADSNGHHIVLFFGGEPEVALSVHGLNGVGQDIDEGQSKLIRERGDRRDCDIVFLNVQAETFMGGLHNG